MREHTKKISQAIKVFELNLPIGIQPFVQPGLTVAAPEREFQLPGVPSDHQGAYVFLQDEMGFLDQWRSIRVGE